MADRTIASFFKRLILDLLTVALSFPILLFGLTTLSIIVTGRREDGMGFGAILGFAAGLVLFYCIRGQFSWSWTIAQIIVNAGLTMGELYITGKTFEGAPIAEASYGLILILISVPIFVSVNRQLLDFLAILLKGQRRKPKQENPW